MIACRRYATYPANTCAAVFRTYGTDYMAALFSTNIDLDGVDMPNKAILLSEAVYQQKLKK